MQKSNQVCAQNLESENGWVDPRLDPQPPATRGRKRVANGPDEIAGLIEFCKTGRLYAAERWIADGKPIQVEHDETSPWFRTATPIVVAMESRQFDLAFLLLCNGYDPDLDPCSPLNIALEDRLWHFVDLLLAWGADPTKAHPYMVLNTYQGKLMDRFGDLGVDFTGDNNLAEYLSNSTRNKPAYGWARRHRQDPKVAYQLALGLGDAVFDDREKAVNLLLWAGADPHRRVPSLRYGSGIEDDPDDDRDSAIETAVHLGHGKLLRHMKPDPAIDDFDELYECVRDPHALRHLTACRMPKDWSKAIMRNISRVGWAYGWAFENKQDSLDCLKQIIDIHGGRLTTLDHAGCQDLRKSILKWSSDYDLKWILRSLTKPEHCDPEIYHKLTRTPTIKARMRDLGLIRAVPKKRGRIKRTRSVVK